MSEVEELRAELARMWEAAAPVLPPQKGAHVKATVSHAKAGISRGSAGYVYGVNGRTRFAYFYEPAKVLAFDVTDPHCGVEWER